MNSFGARFGVLVKERRGVEGLTQQALAVIAFGEEANKARISELENGRVNNPQQRVIDALSVALNLSDDEIASCRKPRVPELPSGFPEGIGMTDELVEALSWRFGFENPKASSEQYQQFLNDKSMELTNLRSRIGMIGETSTRISNMMAAAKYEIEKGHFEEADDILCGAEEIQQEEHTLAQVRKQAEIRIVRAEGALFKGDDELAYSHYKAAAEFFTPFDPVEGARHRRSHYTALYDHAMRFGGSSLRYAAQLAEINVSIYAALDQKFEHGQALSNVAVFKQQQAQRASGARCAELFVEAIAAHEAALEFLSSETKSLEWAMEQDNLGITLANQSYRASEDQRHELVSQAIAAHEAALSALSSGTHPLEWAKVQNNLGSTLQTKAGLEEADDCSSSLALAINAYKAALSALDSDPSSDDRMRTLNNLATALLHLGSITSDQRGLELLHEAIKSFEDLLEICTRETHPLIWAVVQENIGQTTEAIEERGNSVQRRSGLQRVLKLLDGAITVYAEVSDERRLKECSEHRTMILQKLALD